AYLGRHRPAEAKPYLERAVALAPDRATFLTNLAYTLQQLGDLPGALAVASRATEKDPKLGSAWLELGSVLADQGRLDDAERAIRKAAEIDPEDPRAKGSIADLAELRKK